MKNKILYEDNHLIIINKSAGEIVQSDKTGDISLTETVKNYIKEKYNKPYNVYLGLPHRLDRPVSGAVIFAKTSKALSRLNKMFKEGAVKKTYYAICSNTPPSKKQKLTNHLYRNRKQNKSYVREKPDADTKEAVLEYELIASSKSFYLLRINLITGRHHQIRAQLSNINCPIKGDLKYNYPRSNKDGGISLHAREVEFLHPVKKEIIKISAPYPDNEKVWTYF